MIIIGGALVVAGWLAILLMTMRVLPSSYLLAFLSYACSLGGLAAGLLGLVMFVRLR